MQKSPIQKEELQIIEALLFSTSEPLTQSKVNLCFDNGNAPSLNEIIPQLQNQYDKNGSAIIIEHVAGGFRLVTRPEFEPWVRRLHTRISKTPLSQAALEVLAIIAYRGPVTRVEIENIRGVHSGSVIKTLLEKKLIKIKGRAEGPGRALLYTTTDAFLITFGLNKLSDLPKLREISELMEESSSVGHSPQDSSGEDASE